MTLMNLRLRTRIERNEIIKQIIRQMKMEHTQEEEKNEIIDGDDYFTLR